MPYWTVKDDNSNITIVQTTYDDVFITIGTIEKPYRESEYYFVTDYNGGMLYNNGSLIFRTLEEAKQRIITHYENEMNVLNGK